MTRASAYQVHLADQLMNPYLIEWQAKVCGIIILIPLHFVRQHVPQFLQVIIIIVIMPVPLWKWQLHFLAIPAYVRKQLPQWRKYCGKMVTAQLCLESITNAHPGKLPFQDLTIAGPHSQASINFMDFL